MKQEPDEITVSVVVPVYAGQDYLEDLIAELGHLRETWEARPECPLCLVETILVDDAAIDNSAAIIDQLAHVNGWVVALHMSRNYGQHGATIAGILHSSGDWVVTLDEDLQHRPSRIPELFRAVAEQASDIVYARPLSGVHGGIFRDISSRTFKRLVRWLTDSPTIHLVNSFRLIRGPIARAAASSSIHDTYFDVALSWFTTRITAVDLDMKDRRHIETKKSGYSLKRLLQHARRMLFSGHMRVLQSFSVFGIAVALLSLLGMTVLLLRKIIDPDSIVVQGWTTQMLGISFFGSLTLFLLGIALQYISTLILWAQGKPTFFQLSRSGDNGLRAYFGQSSEHSKTTETQDETDRQGV